MSLELLLHVSHKYYLINSCWVNSNRKKNGSLVKGVQPWLWYEFQLNGGNFSILRQAQLVLRPRKRDRREADWGTKLLGLQKAPIDLWVLVVLLPWLSQILFCCCCFIFKDSIACSLGWSQTHGVAKMNLNTGITGMCHHSRLNPKLCVGYTRTLTTDANISSTNPFWNLENINKYI